MKLRCLETRTLTTLGLVGVALSVIFAHPAAFAIPLAESAATLAVEPRPEPTQAAQVVQTQPVVVPRYYYGSGAQGFGYYTAPPQQSPAPRAAAPAPTSVGPGVRNWSTGRRSPLHRPWMRPM